MSTGRYFLLEGFGSRRYGLQCKAALYRQEFRGSRITTQNPVEHRRGLLSTTLASEPAWRLRNEKQRYPEDNGGQSLRGQHPAPVVNAEIGEHIIRKISQQDPEYDSQLIQGHEPAAPGRGGDLCDVHRRDHGRGADAQAANEAKSGKSRERVGEACAYSRNGKQEGADKKHAAPAEPVREPACEQSPCSAPDEDRPDRPAERVVSELEGASDVRYRTGDHGRVEAEKQAAERGYRITATIKPL